MTDAEDRIAIRELVERYFAAIDRVDKRLLRSCFTDDARYESTGGTLDMDGGDSIAARLASGQVAASTHVCANVSISFGKQGAQADTMAVAYLVTGHEPGARLMVRGLRYQDRMVRQAGAWRIAHRRHETRWQFDTTSAAPFVP
jgi:hypothetical protein